MDKKKAIVLGGTNAHIDLIKKLQGRNYYVYLLDYYENPIAKPYADGYIQESTLEKEKVLEIAQKLKVDLVIATSVDQANLTACYVMEKMGLHVPYSYKTALEVTNKVLMKKKMVDNDIPTAKYYEINSDYIPSIELEYPVIVKPADCNGSKGVRKIENKNDLVPLIKEASQFSRTNSVVVEEYKQGKEIGVDCFVQNGTANIIMTRQRRKIYKMEKDVQQIYGSFWPANISSSAFEKIQNIANRIVSVFNLDNTPLMIQLILGDDGLISIIEFAPRIGGGENARIIQLNADFDIIESAINSFLGKPTLLKYDKPHKIFTDNLIYAYPAKFGKIEFPVNDDILYSVILKNKNMEIGNNISSSNRVGAFVVAAENEQNVMKKVNSILNKIKVYDTSGNEIMRRNIY